MYVCKARAQRDDGVRERVAESYTQMRILTRSPLPHLIGCKNASQIASAVGTLTARCAAYRDHGAPGAVAPYVHMAVCKAKHSVRRKRGLSSPAHTYHELLCCAIDHGLWGVCPEVGSCRLECGAIIMTESPPPSTGRLRSVIRHLSRERKRVGNAHKLAISSTACQKDDLPRI